MKIENMGGGLTEPCDIIAVQMTCKLLARVRSRLKRKPSNPLCSEGRAYPPVLMVRPIRYSRLALLPGCCAMPDGSIHCQRKLLKVHLEDVP